MTSFYFSNMVTTPWNIPVNVSLISQYIQLIIPDKTVHTAPFINPSTFGLLFMDQIFSVTFHASFLQFKILQEKLLQSNSIQFKCPENPIYFPKFPDGFAQRWGFSDFPTTWNWPILRNWRKKCPWSSWYFFFVKPAIHQNEKTSRNSKPSVSWCKSWYFLGCITATQPGKTFTVCELEAMAQSK